MFKEFKKRKVSNLKENSTLDIDIIRTLGDVKISNLEVENDVLIAENKTLGLRHENIMLQQENTLFNRLKRSGIVLNSLSLLSFMVSTMLSFISGYFIIRNLIKFIGYASIMFVCQIIIFISARYGTVTKNKFTPKYVGLKLMQLSMLSVSIVLNVMFIHSCFKSLLMDLIMLPLCFILDYSTIFFSNLGYDYRTLNFSNGNKKSKLSIIDIAVDNFTYGFRRKLYDKYYENHPELEEEKVIVKVNENYSQVKDKKFDKILEENEQILELNPPQKNDFENAKGLKEIPEENKTKKCSKILSRKYNGKCFKRKVLKENVIVKADEYSKVKNDEIIIQKPIEILEQESIINLVKKDNIKPNKKPDKNINPKYKKIRTFLEQNYNQDDCINSSELQKKFKLKTYEYRNILGQLKNENIVYTSNRKTYLSGKLKAVK